MRFFERLPAPQFLSENAERWNRQWATLKTENQGATFNWYKHEKTPVNQLLISHLMEQTQRHCSYCDAFPPLRGDDSIDHFQPKSWPAFYLLAYDWNNLYASCGHCQKSKMEHFSDALLRPDEIDYQFERYFVYNFLEHKIDPNPAASDTDRTRAEETIRIFDFNHLGQKTKRRHAWERWFNPNFEKIIEDFPYRFLFE